MKQLVLVALLAAVASSAMTLLVSGAVRPVPPPPPPAVSAADFKAALADLERELAALRRDLSSGVRGEAAPSPPGSTEALPVRSDSLVVRDARSAEAPIPAADHLRRFIEALPRVAEGGMDYDGRRIQKQKWMFRGEREVLAWFGLPEIVNAEGEKETWCYEVPTGGTTRNGDPETRSFYIVLNRGRLVDLGD